MSDQVFKEYSKYYDLLYQNKKYREEALFIDKLIKEYKPEANTLLDLGCGTGTHDFIFAELGYQITGVDQSEQMLEVARNRHGADRKKGGQENPVFVQGSLTNFSLEDNRKVDIIVSLFDVVCYLTDYASFNEMGCRLKEYLSPGGLFIFDCWYAPAVYTLKPEVTVKRFENDEYFLTRVAESQLSSIRNNLVVDYDIYIKNKKDGLISNITERHDVRFFFDEELDALLGKHSFKRIFRKVWFSDEEPNEKNWSVLFGYQLLS